MSLCVQRELIGNGVEDATKDDCGSIMERLVECVFAGWFVGACVEAV